MHTALSIAMSDPTGGAGLQQDLQVFRALGVHGAGVVSGLTIQDSAEVRSMLPVFPSVVLDQLRTLLADITPAAIKLGALGSDDVVRNVMLGLAPLAGSVPVVIDPILFSSSGTALLERRAWPALRELISGCALVTPNLREAEALAERDVSTRASTETAARDFIDGLHAHAVLIKGGHRDGAPDDLLATRDASGAILFDWLEGRRIDVGNVHGTGCALSSAIAAGLARGTSLAEAVAMARAFVASAIENSTTIGKGARFLVYS
jgi:hydroxymethylpyrimidine/phosphomethylpyrimidine kinase